MPKSFLSKFLTSAAKAVDKALKAAAKERERKVKAESREKAQIEKAAELEKTKLRKQTDKTITEHWITGTIPKPKTKEEADAYNRSFRASDINKYNEIEQVLGYEVKRSNGCDFACKICEAGAGKYPKDFFWEGWHDGCKCHIVPVILTPDDFDAWNAGEMSKSFITRRSVKNIPLSLKSYVLKNHDLVSENDWYIKNQKYFK